MKMKMYVHEYLKLLNENAYITNNLQLFFIHDCNASDQDDDDVYIGSYCTRWRMLKRL